MCMKNKTGTGHKGRRVVFVTAFAIVLLIILCFSTLVNFITDYMWFKDLGYTEVFLKKLFTELKIGIARLS